MPLEDGVDDGEFETGGRVAVEEDEGFAGRRAVLCITERATIGQDDGLGIKLSSDR